MDIWKCNDEKQKELCMEKAWQEKGKQKNENLITKFSHVSKEIIENLRTWNK